MAEETTTVTPPKKAGKAAPAIPPLGTWVETTERVRLSAPGHPHWVVTADRTYYPVNLVEDKDAPGGLRGEILAHPGHVAELCQLNEGRNHRVLS